MNDISNHAANSDAWPLIEARRLLNEHLAITVPEKGFVLFETGYGPSGLPHVGTFGEVVRTSMVRHAFHVLAPDFATRLYVFSDDMDGLRKVPENVPKQDWLAEYLGQPLTNVPDPFGTHDSFGHHNNARLQNFLDSFNFEYEFKSSTECYKSGVFDPTLLKILEHYDNIINVILPTLGPERQATYSPFLPICPKTGLVLQVPVVERDSDAGTIIYKDSDGKKVETPVTGGKCKLQWKCDWAMRWFALGVDYEMSGKDLIESVKLSDRICRIIGGKPPANLTYELFLDEHGHKISKSKGNGLAVEEWLRYAPQESLSLFMYQKPKTAKRLYFDVIPKAMDEYASYLQAYPVQDLADSLKNPVWHIHEGSPPKEVPSLSFNLLLNLVGACHAEDPEIVWHYISRYAPGETPQGSLLLDQLVHHAVAYYQDFIKPTKVYRVPTEDEARALGELKVKLEEFEGVIDAERLQSLVYEVGKAHEDTFPKLRDWFRALYQILLGQEQGPRMGSFIALYGLSETAALLTNAMDGGMEDIHS